MLALQREECGHTTLACWTAMYWMVGAVVWMWNGRPHSFLCLNSWSPALVLFGKLVELCWRQRVAGDTPRLSAKSLYFLTYELPRAPISIPSLSRRAVSPQTINQNNASLVSGYLTRFCSHTKKRRVASTLETSIHLSSCLLAPHPILPLALSPSVWAKWALSLYAVVAVHSQVKPSWHDANTDRSLEKRATQQRRRR